MTQALQMGVGQTVSTPPSVVARVTHAILETSSGVGGNDAEEIARNFAQYLATYEPALDTPPHEHARWMLVHRIHHFGLPLDKGRVGRVARLMVEAALEGGAA